MLALNLILQCLFFKHSMGRKGFISEFEQMVLLSILQLNEDAYAPNVARHLEATVGRTVSRGALYSCLNQLDRKDYLRWKLEAPASDAGGYTRRRYQVAPRGLRALRASRVGLLTLWRGLEDLLGGER